MTSGMPSARIPVTHVGSLVRPEEIVRYARAMEDGVAVDEDALDRCLQRHIEAVVKRQFDTGIDIISDGEFGKFHTWSFYIRDRLSGLEEQEVRQATGAGADYRRFPEFYAEYFPTQNLPARGKMVAVAPIKYAGQAAIKQTIDHLEKALDKIGGGQAFIPLVAPASAVPRHGNGIYKSDEEFLFALAEALHEEYRAVIDAGFTLQVDDAFLPYMWDMAYTDRGLKEFRQWAGLRVAAVNHALKGLPEERIRYHICWGSFNTPHTTDIPARDIIDLVLGVNAGAYCIEMGNPRHEHEWRLWEEVKLPDGKTLIPGVISHSSNVVEHPELVAERLTRLAGLVGRDNLMAGTDCGFAQSPLTRRVHPSIQWAKLEALVEGARLASRQLWQ